jgi:hypothetical protein
MKIVKEEVDIRFRCTCVDHPLSKDEIGIAEWVSGGLWREWFKHRILILIQQIYLLGWESGAGMECLQDIG